MAMLNYNNKYNNKSNIAVYLLNHVRLFMTTWIIAHWAPLYSFPDKNTGVGYHFLLQGVFPTQG